MQVQEKDKEQIKQELSELLDKYYNSSFALLVREYIRTAGMTEEEREALVEDVKKEYK
jgi:predicted transcriptional regulator